MVEHHATGCPQLREQKYTDRRDQDNRGTYHARDMASTR